MADHTRYKIEIYCEGVVTTAPMRGKRRYRLEKTFLDALVGHPHPAHLPPRPIPDPHHDMYMLDHEQLAAYGAFRRNLRKALDDMATGKAQLRLNRAANAPIPREFQSFCVSLLLAMRYAGATPEQWVQYVVNDISREDQEAALRFLNRIAADNYDAANLQRFWDAWTSQLGLSIEGDLRAFLLSIGEEMAKVVRPSVVHRHSRR